MKDYELIRVAKMIDRHNERIREIIARIEESGRDDAGDIVEQLYLNEFPTAASAQAVVADFVGDKWELVFGQHIQRKSDNETN